MTGTAWDWLDAQSDLLLSARHKVRSGARHLLTEAEEDALTRWPGTAVHLYMFSLKTDSSEKPMRWTAGEHPGPLDGRPHP